MPPECIKSHQREQTNPSRLAESKRAEIGFVLTSALLNSAAWQDDSAVKLRKATGTLSFVFFCKSDTVN